MISIIVPYLSSSRYIDYFKLKLKENTSHEYELIEIVNETDVYYAYNRGVYQAKYDSVILMNDDMVPAPRWDMFFAPMIAPGVVVTGHVVEPDPGSVTRGKGFFSNVKYDCGRSIDDFDYDKFVEFAERYSKNQPDMSSGFGWYMPVGFHKSTFVSYPNLKKFPYPNDILLLDDVLPSLGYRFGRANSLFYHFQSKSWK